MGGCCSKCDKYLLGGPGESKGGDTPKLARVTPSTTSLSDGTTPIKQTEKLDRQAKLSLRTKIPKRLSNLNFKIQRFPQIWAFQSINAHNLCSLYSYVREQKFVHELNWGIRYSWKPYFIHNFAICSFHTHIIQITHDKI